MKVQNQDQNDDTPPIFPRMTAAVDVFSLGCVFFNVMLPEVQHPFGEWYERECSILLYHPVNLMELKADPEALALIRGMIDPNPLERLRMPEILDHPYFWSADKSLQFLLDSKSIRCVSSDKLGPVASTRA